MRCQETIQKYAKHQIKKSSQQWRLNEDWSFSRILRGWTSPHSAARSLGDPSQNRNVKRCIVSHQLHATIHLAYGRCPWEVAFFPPTSQDFAQPKLVARSPLREKKKPWPSRHGWQASYYKLASHKGDQGAWNPTTCEWLYRFWDCKRTGWSFTWLESQYDNESYGIWCMNQESPWKRMNHCPKGVS